MALQIAIFDKTTPLISFIGTRSYGLAREALTKTGMDIKDRVIQAGKHERTQWWHGTRSQIPKGAEFVGKVSGSKENRYIWRDIGRSHALGMMIDHTTGKQMVGRNVLDVISSYISPKGGLSVTIGGSHKTARILEYKDGVIDGDYGVLKGRGKISRAIFHKLNTGEINSDHPYSKNDEGYESTKKRYVANRDFMESGRIMAQPEMMKKLNYYYEKVLPNAVANADLQAIIINTRKSA